MVDHGIIGINGVGFDGLYTIWQILINEVTILIA